MNHEYTVPKELQELADQVKENLKEKLGDKYETISEQSQRVFEEMFSRGTCEQGGVADLLSDRDPK